MLEIVYRDEDIVAINKPHGLLVHRSPIAKDAEKFALQLLRDQIGQHVYPVHRLDRKTGGILLFALNVEASRQLHQLFAHEGMQKTYHAIVRGYTLGKEVIDYPLRKEDGKVQEAVTAYTKLREAEMPVKLGKHPTSRYSFLEISPLTGRMHQIRKHMAHIRHPIIGDRPHGCNKQNRLFKECWQMDTMLLHASRLRFQHPISQREIILRAGFQSEFIRMINLMGFEQCETLRA